VSTISRNTVKHQPDYDTNMGGGRKVEGKAGRSEPGQACANTRLTTTSIGRNAPLTKPRRSHLSLHSSPTSTTFGSAETTGSAAPSTNTRSPHDRTTYSAPTDLAVVGSLRIDLTFLSELPISVKEPDLT
jgi:hypothetical protein